jgi:hypothetical protein
VASQRVVDYEELRRQVLAPQSNQQPSSGWVLLVRQGMAAWIHAGLLPSASPTTTALSSVATCLSQNLQGQVAQIWANMALSRYPFKTV